jgi:hypothetical protein
MTRRRRIDELTTRIATAVAVAALVAAGAWAQEPARPEIALGATTAQRNEAARALIPLLGDVKRRAEPGVKVAPADRVPDSPFAGTQTTLFAFSITRKSTPVDVRVVEAMERLLAWEIGAPGRADTGRLFDEWLGELMQRTAGAVALQGGPACDVTCVARRMTTLDETWGASPRGRSETRDGLLLDALAEVVTNR